MKSIYKLNLGVIGTLLAFGLLFTACSSPEQQAKRRVDREIDKTTKEKKETIKADIEQLKAQVDASTVEAGNLPSQQYKAELAKADLDEIGKRLEKAAELEGEQAKQELQNAADGYDGLIEEVNQAAAKATGEEKAELTAFASYLETRKQEVIEAINSMP